MLIQTWCHLFWIRLVFSFRPLRRRPLSMIWICATILQVSHFW